MRKQGFTLIELLVVISIIALLIAILLPVLGSVRYESANFLCLSRQRQWTIATHAYCTDNKEFYPDRGIDNDRAEPMWARWAARMWIDRGVDDELDDVLGDYMSESTAVWVCPQYDGAHGSRAWAGCLEHGKGHYEGGNQNNFRWTTYAFHGGLREYGNTGHTYNPGDRRKMGDPYIIELSDGRVYESGLLMSDVAADDNAWVPCYYPGQGGRFTAQVPVLCDHHQPPAQARHACSTSEQPRLPCAGRWRRGPYELGLRRRLGRDPRGHPEPVTVHRRRVDPGQLRRRPIHDVPEPVSQPHKLSP